MAHPNGDAQAGPTSIRRTGPLILGAILLLTAAAYGRALHGEFQFDDAHVIESNAGVKGGLATVVGAIRSPISSRPVSAATFALNYAAGRLDPFGYHAVNLALHLCVVVLLWRFALVLLGRAGLRDARSLALVVAGTWSLHPLNSQAVAYVAQRSELLAALFAVATVLCLLRAETATTAWRRALLAIAGVATYGLGLGSKLTAVIAPLLWLLVTLGFPAQRGATPRQRLARILPVVAPFAAAAVVAAASTLSHLEGRVDAGFSVPGAGPWPYLITQTRAILLYARLLAWPVGQNVDHDLRIFSTLDVTAATIGLLFLASIAAAVLLLLRPPPGWSEEGRARGRLASLGVLWWFVALAPTSSVIPVIDAAVEHRAYLASFGLILSAIVGVDRLLALLAMRQRPRVAFALVLCVWAALAAALHARASAWETRLALWSDAASKAPGKIRAQANLAFALQSRGDMEGAIAGYRRALTLGEDPIVTRVDLMQYLGAALVQSGRPAEAAPVLLEALASDPWNLALLNTTAITMLELGRPADAERLAASALQMAPDFGPGLNTLGESLLAQGRLEEALAAFQRAAALDRDVALRQLNVARVAARLGRRAVACTALVEYRSASGGAQGSPETSRLWSDLSCAP